jgi:XTP/dITP diphosphohydrolase
MQPVQEVFFGSFNPHKWAEVRAMLGPTFAVRYGADYPGLHEADETALTLEGNALLKAHSYRQQTGLPTFADDTGLEVAALHNAPGVHSAHYAGEPSSAKANMHKLLAELAPHTDKTARFRTVVAYIDAAGQEHLFHGTLNGVIIDTPRGDGGFGYDPIFVPATETRTLAELTLAEKNGISHRALAILAFIHFLQLANAATVQPLN